MGVEPFILDLSLFNVAPCIDLFLILSAIAAALLGLWVYPDV